VRHRFVAIDVSAVGGDVTSQACTAIFDLGGDGDVDNLIFADFLNAYERRLS
jgi:hypothetical protein